MSEIKNALYNALQQKDQIDKLSKQNLKEIVSDIKTKTKQHDNLVTRISKIKRILDEAIITSKDKYEDQLHEDEMKLSKLITQISALEEAKAMYQSIV